MIQRSAILLKHVSSFSYCLLIIKLYWGVKWITIKKNVYWSRCKFTDTPENFLFHDLKEILLVSANSHQFLLRHQVLFLLCHVPQQNISSEPLAIAQCPEMSEENIAGILLGSEHKSQLQWLTGAQRSWYPTSPFPAVGNQESRPCCEKQLP